MSKTNDELIYRGKNPYPSTIAQKFQLEYKNYDIIAIVEGTSDEDFYKKTNIDILNRAYYIFATQDGYNSWNKPPVGKEAVIEAYFRIRKWMKIPTHNSIIFIVDKDFFGINWKAPKYNHFKDRYGATLDDIDNFTILDFHSHECYFILENNLKQIFKLLNIEDKLEQFNNILENNLEDFSEYFAYKSILEDENPKYPRLARDWKNIKGINFKFEFRDNKLVFNKEDMQGSIDIMKKEIINSDNRKSLASQYSEMKKEFKAHPELLRGHTLFELLECYLNHYGKTLKNYKEYNDEIIKEMDIPLKIRILTFDGKNYKQEE